MRQIPLTTIRGGITRLRTKGAALNDSLYDLLNGYVTSARTVKQRPGTIRVHELPPGTKGLVSFGGRLHVFATELLDGIPEDVVLVVLRSPDHSEDEPRTIKEIHFAEPFLGFLYVAAEFDDGNTYHFWLEAAPEWQPNTIYKHGDLVSPVGGDAGFVYRARRGSDPYPVWQASIERTIGDRIEPTVYNDFFFEAVATTGDNPRSGLVEPDWPTESGSQITESPDFSPATSSPTTAAPPAGGTPGPDQPTGSTRDRYGLNVDGGARPLD